MCRRHREQAQLPQFSGVIMRFELHPESLWELSLLAIAEGQLARMLNVPPPSRASSAPTVFRGDNEIRATPRIPVGASLLAIAEGQLARMLNVPPPSRASSAPTVFRGDHEIRATPRIPVGASPLAIAVGQLARMLNVPPPSRASSAPTVFRGDHEIRATPRIPCGSGLARDSGGSACKDVECAAAIASKLSSHSFPG
ncbi:hypothetical protein SAMN04490188_4612 [Pseudomonas kilonensis]|uniref:Uncharacterized protein n=1 Tax=Pseudomonas kilonensis TaxID=132476 RepID=A0ABY0ZFF3_9PSED|nr:hypothetical protein SAMN04490188_4612 [Pseudomonas kilonensis]